MDTSRDNLQTKTTKVYKACKRFGLRFNIPKCKTMVVGKDRELRINPISVNNETIEDVGFFVYLGSTLTNNASPSKDITRRITLNINCLPQAEKIWKDKIYL